MRIVLRAWAILIVAAKRLVAQRGLALAVILGLVVAVALAVSLPLYADAVNYRVLQEQLDAKSDGAVIQRPPFAFMYMYMGSLSTHWNGPIPSRSTTTSRIARRRIWRLPQKLGIRYFATDKLALYNNDPAAYGGNQKPLEWINLSTVNDLASHINLLEGRFPNPATPADDSTIEVLAYEELATKLGLQTGETYILLDRSGAFGKGKTTQIPVRITGIWNARDENEDYWFFRPDAFTDAFLVPEETFRDRISLFNKGEVYLAVWYQIMDGAGVHAESVGSLVANILRTQQTAIGLLPNLQLSVSPMESLEKYQQSTSWLSIVLYAFSVPILGMVLVFVGLVAGLAAERQRNETAIFRSRGAAIGQVVGITFSEGVLLGAVALILGLLLGERVAGMMGHARGFLDFSAQTDLRINLTTGGLRLGIILLGVALLTQMAPSFANARHTIITYKQEQRPGDAPALVAARLARCAAADPGRLWDLSPAPAGQRGRAGGRHATAARPVPESAAFPGAGPGHLQPDPADAAGAAAADVGARLAHQPHAQRRADADRPASSRTYSAYTAPLILLVLTLSLSAYTASLAETMDNHTYQQQAYGVGADLMLDEIGASSAGPRKLWRQQRGRIERNESGVVDPRS